MDFDDIVYDDDLMWDRNNPDPSYYGEEGGDL